MKRFMNLELAGSVLAAFMRDAATFAEGRRGPDLGAAHEAKRGRGAGVRCVDATGRVVARYNSGEDSRHCIRAAASSTSFGWMTMICSTCRVS